MKVILKEYIYKHGVAGDVVNVAPGFARNYLIPRGLAIKATPNALRQNHQLIVQSVDNRERLHSMESETAAKIDGIELVFGVKAGKNNKLYGSVTTRDIAAALQEKVEVDINRRRISERPLRELGIHAVPVRFSSEVSPTLQVVIVREEEVDPYLAGEVVDSLRELQEASGEKSEAELVDAETTFDYTDYVEPDEIEVEAAESAAEIEETDEEAEA